MVFRTSPRISNELGSALATQWSMAGFHTAFAIDRQLRGRNRMHVRAASPGMGALLQCLTPQLAWAASPLYGAATNWRAEAPRQRPAGLRPSSRRWPVP